ncbi:phosphoribosylglycinamide formyltransferase [Marinagarivorans cellulosilyticus]|uniref:Phosphoribosylglycinamide formyltransferase n=1 Tax=Marinagarivorans cellulosilyticus TaxID=2721545 RepID=A0AAN2BLH1_9GAMM|nr:phosphoribosylglycinamide formyltransferase [Marinagarivorans cellulosilyticus]BCD99138.1 phosphoribosylglycinamide formyltransferase 1 [Marinagarivorans cellulosilyticus]
MRIVVLISGSGSNLQAIIDGCNDGRINGSVVAVISNRPDVKGLERARNHGIEAITLDHRNFDSRETFDAALAQHIDNFEPELVILAGFMRILTPTFTGRYLGRMLNIHPSLLPKYPGLHTHKRALEAGDSEHGVTVHFVTAELDGGPAVLQARVPILESDTEDTLAARVLEQEHRIYPQAAGWFCEGRLTLQGNAALLDNTPINTTL